MTNQTPAKSELIHCPRFEREFSVRECVMLHVAGKKFKGPAVCRDCVQVLDYMPIVQKSDSIMRLLRAIYPQFVSEATISKRLAEWAGVGSFLETLASEGLVTSEAVCNPSGPATTVYRLAKDPSR